MEEKNWSHILADFAATRQAKPNLTDAEWFEKFPEFGNNVNLLHAAFDYDETVKSGKYPNEAELQSKFPEFWPTPQRVDVSDVQKAEQGNMSLAEATEIPTVTMDKVDEQPQQPNPKFEIPTELTNENFMSVKERASELNAERRRIMSELDSDNEMQPLTISQRQAYERQINDIDTELAGLGQFVDEWNKTDEAKAYFEQMQAQSAALDDAISQTARNIRNQRADKQREQEEGRGFWSTLAHSLSLAENPITPEVVDVFSSSEENEIRAAQNEVRNANNQLKLEHMRMNGEMKGLAFLRGLETANYYELIPAIGLADAASILSLKQDIESGKELTETQQLLYEAMKLRAGVDYSYQDNNTIWERVGQSAPEQLMFTLQFVVGAGLTGATEVGERMAAKSAQKAAMKYARKGVNSGARRFIGGTVMPKLEGMAVSATMQTFMNPLSLSDMAEDFERRYAGDIYYDNQGNLHVFDNDRSAGQAAYQAIASAWIENFTEYTGENITKSIKMADGKMFDLAGKFDNVMKRVGAGKIQDVFRIPQQLGHLTQIGSAPEEFLEEELGSVMNAMFATDAQRGESYGDAFKRTIGQSFSSDQQLETLLSCTITSMLLGGGGNAVNAVGNAGYRKQMNREVEQSKALLGKVHGIDIAELDNQIENGEIGDIASYLKAQSDANGWSQDEQGAAVSYVLNRSRQIGVRHNDETAIEQAQSEMRKQAEDMANRWDGNIYNATWKDGEGNEQAVTIINGRVHYSTRENGSIHFNPYTSSGMFAIRLADGTKKQVPSRSITDIQSVMSVDEQLEAQGQTIPQMMRAQFEQEGMAVPTVESVWGGNLEANVTQLENGRYTYLGKDQNGLYAFANNDKKTQKDNPIVYMTERQLVEYGLSLNIQSADEGQRRQAQEDMDFMQHLDELTQEATESQQWDVVKAYAQKGLQFEDNGMISVESDPHAYAPYLLACSEGSFENAVASIDQSIATLVSAQGQQAQAADVSADAGYNAETHANMEHLDETTAKAIDFYTNTRNALIDMQQGQQEAQEEEAVNTPVSQMEVGTEFPVNIQDGAVARVEGKDADGRSVVSVYDADGNILEAGIDDWSDEAWENVKVKPQAAMESQQEGTEPAQESSEIEQNPPTIEQKPDEIEQKEPEIEQKEETPLSPAQQTYNDLVQKYGEKAGHKIDVTAEDKSKTLDKAKKALEKAQQEYDDAPIGKEEKAEAALEKAQQEYETALAEQQEWNDVKSVKDRFVAEQLAAQQAAEEQRRAEAVAEEQARQEAEERKAQERAELGSNNVAPSIREKWDAAIKAEGNADEITLANGERVTGHYVLVESGAASPSHNALDGFRKTEGFPMDENEQSVNDRDYERDPHAQSITRQIAADYDNRALQTPVVVSQDGVVLSGNGRTMAGEIAAAQNTDGAYIDYLKRYAQKYGFAPEEVEAMQHPRVVFVLDASMPYTADTFAKFNQQEMKGQSKTEQAVKLGKLVDDATFGRIIRSINRFDTLGDFYADSKATADAIGELLNAGAINQMQHAEMFDGESISAQGREILENMLIGKAFESNPDAVRQLTAYKSLRQSVITALAEISNNIALGENYSLESELSQAIALAYQARQNGYKAGDRVSEFARTGVLFQGEALTVAKEGATAADYTNATVLMLADLLNDNRVTRLKKALQVYNHQAEQSAGGQTDLFAGDVRTRQDILNEVLLLLQHGTESEQQQALDDAVEQRKSAAEQSVQQDGVADASHQEERGAETAEEETVGGGNEELHVPQVPQTSEEIEGENPSDEGFFLKPDVEVERIRSLRQALADGYASGNKEAIQKAVDELKKYVDEGLDTDGYYSEEIDDYEGDDPMMLAERYITHLYQDRYLDDDEDQEYIKTGIRSVASQENAVPEQSGYTISPAQYTTKKGKVLNMQLVKFDKALTKEQQRAANALARDLKGWWSRDDGGFMMRDEETAQQLIDAVLEESGETLQESAPLSLSDMRGETEKQTGPTDSSVAAANDEVDTNPTEAQKEAGNYKKGHVKIDGFDISIENPAGSTRSGTDAQGNPWSVTMHNSYGYIRMTEGVDGDHIDVFLSDHIDDWNGTVYVVDQVNEDGSFDEHKVMYGFNSSGEAMEAYLSNYSKGWKGLGAISGVSKKEFKKWVDSSHRKTKPFAEYRRIQEVATKGQNETDNSSLRDDVPTELREEQRADELFDSVNVGDVFVNDRGLTATIVKKVNGGKANSSAVQVKWEQAVENGQNGRGVEIFNKIKFLKYVEANGMRKKSVSSFPFKVGDRVKFRTARGTFVGFEQGKPYIVFDNNGGSLMVREEDFDKIQLIEEKEESTTSTYGASNRLVSQSRYEELKRKMQEKLGGQMNMGIDPEILAIGTEMAVYHIEAGARKFADFCKNMVADLGDAIRPYLKSFYNGARDLPEMEEAGYLDELTPYEEVKTFDVNGFDKGGSSFVETAQEAVKEAEVEQQAKEAVEKIKEIAQKGKKITKKKEKVVSSQPSLFGEETENTETNQQEDGLQRNDEPSSAGLPAESVRHEEGGQPKQTTSSEGVGQENRGTDTDGGGNRTQSDRPLQSGLQRLGHTTKEKSKEQVLRILSKGNKFLIDFYGVSTEFSGTYFEMSDVVYLSTGKQGGVIEYSSKDFVNAIKAGTIKQIETQQSEPAIKKNTRNNHAERGTDYAPKSVDARIESNIKAIELMKQLIESGEQATPEQMAVLRQFSGWGGLGKAFSDTTEIYGVKTTAGRLRDLLGDEEYEQANMSRNSAYYTPAEIIDTLWDIARAMGFNGGSVLEGSAGIGNILGLMPTDISERSDIQAVEIDQTTGNILSLLYPDAKVEVQGFEATKVENGSVDLAITNVPFVPGMLVPKDTSGDADLSRKFYNSIQDFCIAKNIRKLREGGIGIFITSKSTLDDNTKLREWIVNEGGSDVVGAFRLNNETFGGTGATSDIVIVRKRVNGKKSPHAIDVSTTSGERVAEFHTGATKKVKGEEVPIVKQLSMDYNKYFIEHPEMMAGVMEFGFEHGETYRATSKALYPTKDKDQSKMLSDWIKSFEGKDWEKADVDRTDKTDRTYEELGEDVKEGSMVVNKDGVLCIAQRGQAVPLEVNANKVKGHTKVECFQAYQGIKKALADVLTYQTENEDDNGLNPLLKGLNKAYDDFVKTYGHLHKNTAINFLKNDVDWPNIIALEKFSETGDKKGERVQTFGKTDIFSKRVVDKEKDPEPKNVKDGIIASIYLYGRIDVPYLSQHLGMSEEEIRSEIVSQGLGFENPTSREMEVSYEYLSGNVREKLRQAQENNSDGRYNANIKALEERLPMSIPAHLIDFSIGSSWIDPKLYADYVKERTDVSVSFAAAGGTWFMRTPNYVNEQKNRAFGVISEILQKTIMGTQLIEAAMQNRTITVSETHKHSDGTTETITDQAATQACASKIDEIRQDFKDWAKAKMQSDPEMSERMERVYNEMFNNYVPKEIPDEFVPQYFGGATHSIQLRPHQSKAVIRGTTQPLLLAHEVGTGKTFTLISTAMEMRRLGTATKPMIVVQNATVGQFVESAKQLYPNAKVLTIEDKDHTSEGRKNFYAKIKYNDWDMIVVPQSVFERIPDSEERQMAFVKDKIEEKMLVLEQMRDADDNGRNPIVRQAEREIEELEDQMAALSEALSAKRKTRDAKKEAVTRQNAEVKALEMLDRATDDVENFDDMGIDAILVDEAHEYKHLGFATAMQRGVKGVDPSYSKKAQGVFLKAQAVLEKNNGRNVIFATGTPISNTAAEIWTFMRYLMPAETMQEYGIYYFDDFVRNFGNIQQMLEHQTNGKFKENNRFAGYINLPELVRIWSGVADTVLTREAGGVNDKIPDMEGGKAQDIYLSQTKALRSIIKFVKAELARYEEMTGKEKKENSHIPLVMYGIAKAAAVDARLVDSSAEDDPNSKTNEAVRQTLRSLEETKDYRGTVAIFADNYQNKESGFNIYEDIRQKLIDAGVPAEQIVVMKSGMSVKKKLEIFDKMNKGEVRVMMGSTFTLGTGVNIQERLHTLIHLDAPNRPMDYTQRNGRILRQGNIHKQMGKPVRVLRFGVEDSLDVTAYQRLKTKGAIADSIMNGKSMMANSMENRVLEEEEDVFGDTVAQLSGSEYAMLKNQAEKDVRKYEAKRKQWEADQTYIHNQMPRLQGSIRAAQKRIEEAKAYLEKLASVPEHPKIIIGKYTFGSIDEMADFIKEYNAELKQDEAVVRGNMSNGEKKHRKLTVNVGGIDFVVNLTMTLETVRKGTTLSSVVKRDMTYSCEELGLNDVPVFQMLFRNAIEDILTDVITGIDARADIESAESVIERDSKALEQLKEREGVPFAFEKELQQAHQHLDEYSELMKKEMEEKEAKYAEMDSEVEAATGLTEAEEAEEESDVDLSVREEQPPVKTGIGYKVFVLKDGKLYPPMVANPNGEATPVGVWLDADAAPIAGESKTGRPQVKAGGKGTQGGSGQLAYRPGWHLGTIPYAIQFNRKDENGEKTLFPKDFVWAEVEYADDVDYQQEAESYGVTESGKYRHSYAGLPRVPKDGSYTYRTNPNPETDPWIITGAMRVKRILTPSEVDAMVIEAGREPQRRESGAVTDEEVNYLNGKADDAQSVAYDAVREALANAGIDVVMATTEDVEKLKASVRSIEDSKGVVRGWVGNNGKIYLTKDGMTAETPIHEYTHLWADALQMNNPELWEQIKELLKGTPEWNRILSSPGYSYLRKRNGEVKDEDRLAGEVLAHISGKKNAERMEAEAKKMIDEAENYAEAAKAASLLGRMRDALKKFWTWVGKTLLGRKGNINIEQVQNMVLADLVNGVDPFGPNGRRRRGKRMSVDDNDTERINQKFNEELQRQIEGTLPSGHVYEMGMPSVYLRSTGIPNLPIRLQSSILNKKSDDPLHPYELEEVKDLVKLIQKPLAIFAYGDKTKSQNLMIGISQPTAEGKQFLVGLALNPDVNGKTLEINSVRNVFPKNYHDWIYWIIQGKMLRVDDRESIKAIIDALRINPVDYISDNDLDSAANIVENFENPQVEGENFSDVDLSIVGPDNHIADEYNRKTGYNSDDVSGYVRGKEELIRSFFDGLRPLEQMQQLIEKALGRKLRDSENAYGLATLLPSLNKAMMDKAETEFMLPVLRRSARIMRRVMRGKGVSMTEAREMLTNYLLAKHGLERNEWFYQQALANDPDAEEEDKAGLRGLAESLGENPDDYKDVAQRIVDEMEDDYLADSIWDDMKALTDRMLEISYEAGMIDKDTFEGLKSRHNYYVPLRGFADGTSGDLFDYVSKHPHFQSIFKKMKGRRSKADDPLANLYNMLQSAVVIGNQNKVMQNIYNLAVNSKSDLLRVAKAWYVHNDVTDEWEEKFPDIPEDATADDIDAIIKQFEADMEQLKQQGQAKQFTNRMQLGKRVLPYQAKEHEMVAYINGKKVMLFVAGNPLVAQALNKSNTQQLGWFAETVQGLTRFASRINTSLSPAFMFTNAARDIGFSLFSATVTGGLKKNKNMVGNLFRAGWVLPRLILTGKMDGGIVKMFSKEEAAKIEQWWNEFIDNGGETGFTSTLSTEKAKGQVDDMIRRMVNYNSKDGKSGLKKATFGVIETMGRYSEDISRFAAYCLKRAEGETVKGSVNEAKNVTVNFNVKGGGNSTIARFVAGCRACYSFFNASLQGINRMGRLAKENPKAFAVCLMACVVQGAMLPWLNMAFFAMLGGDDDDWEKYKMLSEYTANNNLILYVGKHKFLKIQYSQELAPFAAMGNIWFRQQMGWNHGRSIASQVGNMFLDLAPVSMGESRTFGGKVMKTITPTIFKSLMEWKENEDFTGSSIEKRYDWNKFDHGWEKAYENKTAKWLVDATKWLDTKTAVGDFADWSRNNLKIDPINPSFIQHVATGILGGLGRSGDNLMKYFSDGFQMQNAPYLRTIMFDSKQQGYIGAVSREYGRLAYEELPKMKHDVESMDMAEFAKVVNTVDYQIANTVSMYKTGKDLMGNKTSFQGIDKLEKQYKAAQKASDGSEASNEYLQAMRDQINEVKMEMLDAVDEIIYNNSGEGRRGRVDKVKEIEQESKDKYQRNHGEEE